MSNFDSILFDMDGTLWDAVDSYCAVWNATIDRCSPGSVHHLNYSQLATMMGKPLDVIYNTLIGKDVDRDAFMKELAVQEDRLMPVLGGALYPGVKEVLEGLSKTHKLFMVSNCNKHGLPTFLAYTGLTPYFIETISFGETGHEKDYNIRYLVEKHGLQKPLYVGDTAGDCSNAHAAGVPFAWATYGFGRGVQDADYILDSINDLPSIS